MKLLAMALVLLSLPVSAAEPFSYDRQLAVELAASYVRSHFRARPDHAVSALNYTEPAVVSAIDDQQRQLVIITFSSPANAFGAYVVLQQCKEIGLLVVAEEGTVDNIASYRKDASTITAHTFVSVPHVCPSS